jgi:hypothetical protein
MAVGCLINVWFAGQLPQWMVLWANIGVAVGCYAGAKYFVGYWNESFILVSCVFHVASHVFVSMLHFAMLYFYSKFE